MSVFTSTRLWMWVCVCLLLSAFSGFETSVESSSRSAPTTAAAAAAAGADYRPQQQQRQLLATKKCSHYLFTAIFQHFSIWSVVERFTTCLLRIFTRHHEYLQYASNGNMHAHNYILTYMHTHALASRVKECGLKYSQKKAACSK